MNIGQLQTQDLRHSVPAVHPRLAVIKASAEQRRSLVDAARAAGAVVVDHADAGAALDADARRRQIAHDRAVEAQRARLNAATTNFEQATLRDTKAQGTVTEANQAIAAFDDLATEAFEADARRGEAGPDRRGALQQLVDTLEKLERVQEQRRDAAATLKEAEAQVRTGPQPGPANGGSTNGDHRRDAATEQLQAHVTAVHAALDKAESASQSEVTAAEQRLISAMAEVTEADAAMTGIWERLAEVVDEALLNRWGHGHPEPGMIAEHRQGLITTKEAADWDRSSAAAALATATRHQADEARRLDELAGPGVDPGRAVDALGAWLFGITSAHASDSPAPAPVVLDDTLAELDPGTRASLLAALAGPSCDTQLIYLTEQVDVLAWAISLSHDIGGINHVLSLSRPVLALSD
jgi:uncharacterized protein YhaN